MLRSVYALAFASSLLACSSPSSQPDPSAETTSAATTSGGELAAGRTAPPPAPPAIRTTTPVPVPQPAVAREDLSDSAQLVWTSVEETVALRPPEPPAATTMQAANEWARGPWSAWINTRTERTREVVAHCEGVQETPPYERALAAALLGYAIEDFVAVVRGAPVPEPIAIDPELLEVYVGALNEQVLPLAVQAVTYYAYCQRRLEALGDESPWLPWRAYCVQRGQEIIETYELSAPAPQPPE
ncbi:MAG TPA: hypothetical protein ENK57_00865 [Polyangiaceae bacterium]|nr:hypothetical protein [Polyangiaceae bacterium]